MTSARLTKKKKKDKFSSKNNYLIYFNIYSHLFPVVFHQFAKSIDFCRGFAAVHFEVRPKLQTSSEITEKSIIDIEIYKNFWPWLDSFHLNSLYLLLKRSTLMWNESWGERFFLTFPVPGMIYPVIPLLFLFYLFSVNLVFIEVQD